MTPKAFLTHAVWRRETVATAEQWRMFVQLLEKEGQPCVCLCMSDPPVMFIFLRREGGEWRVGGEGEGHPSGLFLQHRN